ncbi:MAG: hypothetical protein H0U85_08325 [Gemmatimonadales bacterium]|nr:hypothetical protein [Gemmatimonadales bacterium]
MLFVEQHQIVPIIMPVNLATGANDGDYVSLKGWTRVTFVILAAIGAAAEDIIATVRQATSVAGANAKDLVAITRADVKQGADLTTVGAYTKVAQALAATYTSDTGGETQNLHVLEVESQDLDVNGGFDCVTLNIADTGATAKLGCVIAILSEPRGSANVSAIVD